MARPHRVHAGNYVGGHRVFLTLCTFQRRKYFDDPHVVSLVRAQILHTAQVEGVAILAYCFMPDHLHLVVECERGDADVAGFVKMAKQRAGFQFSRERHHRLWQESFFDRALRRDEALNEVVRYVIANPIRAGLVAEVGDYPYWGSGMWSRQELLEFVQCAGDDGGS